MSDRLYTEGELTQWLETTAITPRPDYVDDLLARTASSRQRSAWRFPERWLPMEITARAPTITRRQVPLRLIGLVALVVLALAVGATLFVASQRRLPAPFGPAANGVIVYAAPTDPAWMAKGAYQRPVGDIMTVDPVSGTSSVLVGGPTVDGYPAVSLDGTRVAFVREDDRGQMLYVVDTAGGDPRPLTQQPLQEIDDAVWSPDGQTVAFAAREGKFSNLWLARSDGSEANRVDLGTDLSVVLPQWLPPDGDELLLVGSTKPSLGFLPDDGYRDILGGAQDPTGSAIGLYTVNSDGSNLRPITSPDGAGYDYGVVAWTPAGDRILTQTADAAVGGYTRIQVLEANGTPVRRIEPTTGTETYSPVVSPDGQRVAYADVAGDAWTIRVEPIDGSAEPTETGARFFGIAAAFRWSPDGRSLIVTHHYNKQTWLFDASGGAGTLKTWIDPGSNTWQRLAP